MRKSIGPYPVTKDLIMPNSAFCLYAGIPRLTFNAVDISQHLFASYHLSKFLYFEINHWDHLRQIQVGMSLLFQRISQKQPNTKGSAANQKEMCSISLHISFYIMDNRHYTVSTQIFLFLMIMLSDET
jgi:hypothetical protein